MKDIVLSISYALSKAAMKHVPLIGSDLVELAEHGRKLASSLIAQEQEERFQQRDLQQRLDQAFRQFVDAALSTEPQKVESRLFFFIDDLDRCTPDRVVSLLESLKLFLNAPRCIYILGLDRSPVEAFIREQYPWAGASQAEYLDKIIQLRFSLPPVSQEIRESFVRDRLSAVFSGTSIDDSPVLDAVVEIISAGVGGNPRQLKRVMSSFSLMHVLGRRLVENYKPELLALILLIQQRAPALFQVLSHQPERFHELFTSYSDEGESSNSLYSSFVAADYYLSRALGLAGG
jgi:hypothetical protein